MRSFGKVLVANRGEIAIRVFRALRELGIGTVAVYSEADRDALHVRAADEAYLRRPGPPAESYLAQRADPRRGPTRGRRGGPPGYGFLAENAGFARAVEDAGLVWIGPPPEAIEAMGSKIAARAAHAARGRADRARDHRARRVAPTRSCRLGDEYGWPLAIKAAAGGGGKGPEGRRTRRTRPSAPYESARREGEAYFSDSTVYVEKYIEDPRHVEVQVLADAHGTVVHLGERDCTIQRRHQKLVEETPVAGGRRRAARADRRDRRRRRRGPSATGRPGRSRACSIADGNYYFLEMNTRIQVEHTVTEMVTGIDLVREQIRIAAGEPISFRQEDVRFAGHAIECRINAEDPVERLPPVARDDHRLPRAGGPGRPRRLRGRSRARRSRRSTTR